MPARITINSTPDKAAISANSLEHMSGSASRKRAPRALLPCLGIHGPLTVADCTKSNPAHPEQSQIRCATCSPEHKAYTHNISTHSGAKRDNWFGSCGDIWIFAVSQLQFHYQLSVKTIIMHRYDGINMIKD
jgi:hypothetical protein